MVNIIFKTNIPSFHPSIIPFPGQIRKPQKTSIFSVGCRNSETLNFRRACCPLEATFSERHLGKSLVR